MAVVPAAVVVPVAVFLRHTATYVTNTPSPKAKTNTATPVSLCAATLHVETCRPVVAAAITT